MDFLQQLQEQIKNIWQNFSRTQKIVVIGSTLAVFIILSFSAFFLGQTKYEPLYPDLSLNDSAMIVAKLKDVNADYKLADDGTTVLVPAATKHQLRLDLANELPQGGVIGFESFDNVKFGETDTDKRVRYLAALQGELTRTIQQMAEVENAKVHIVLPEPSLFVSDTKPATASVLLKLKPYSSMDVQNIKSIVYFLTHSVEGLSPENVTVMDVYGNLLSEGVIASENSALTPTKLSANQLDIQKKYEDDLSKSLQSMLEKVMGPGRVVVRASVEMDFDQVETNTENYGNSVLRSEQIKEEVSEGTTEIEGGVPGTETNLPETTSYQTGNNTNSSSSESSEIIRNYEIDRVIENRKKAPGEIEKLSVAVIIDGELTVEEQADIENTVARAAGINEERGDLVNVSSLNFNNEAYANIQEQMDAETARQQRMELIKYGVMGLLVFALIGIIVMLIRRGAVRRKLEPKLSQPQTVANYEEMFQQQLSPEDQEKMQMQKRIEKIAKTQPDNVAKVIRTWLAEDSR